MTIQKIAVTGNCDFFGGECLIKHCNVSEVECDLTGGTGYSEPRYDFDAGEPQVGVCANRGWFDRVYADGEGVEMVGVVRGMVFVGIRGESCKSPKGSVVLTTIKFYFFNKNLPRFVIAYPYDLGIPVTGSNSGIFGFLSSNGIGMFGRIRPSWTSRS